MPDPWYEPDRDQLSACPFFDLDMAAVGVVGLVSELVAHSAVCPLLSDSSLWLGLYSLEKNPPRKQREEAIARDRPTPSPSL